jgi:uncharacterized membrane protein YgcG
MTTPAVQVSGGEAFSPYQREEIERAVREAERLSGRAFSVHVGPSEGDPRHTAERLHAALANPAESILIHVDPQLRDLEIVTGSAVRTQLTNRQAALAALGMQTAFAAGDLTRGLLSGLQQLAELSRAPVSLHTDTP